MSELTAKRVAEMVGDFLKTDLGQYYLAQLGLIYNGLHHEAENESLSAEQKAMKIERAAGLKVAIDFLTVRDGLLKQEYFKETPAKQ